MLHEWGGTLGLTLPMEDPKKYSGVIINNKNGGALTSLSSIANSDKSDGVKVSRSEWQKILIKNGYFARSIPKEYGGFGGDIDIIKNRIIAAEFASNRIPPPMGGQGIDMLVPTLLELGTEKKVSFIPKGVKILSFKNAMSFSKGKDNFMIA